MGTDNLFWKRKNQKLKRKSRIRKILPGFLIVCEGEKTEPYYFKAFRHRIQSIRIEILGSGMNTKSLVEYTLEINEKAKKNGENYDQVWCVFDKDDCKLEDFNAAMDIADRNKFKVAYSNNAFELWYLLHFQYFDTAISRKDYMSKLSKHLKDKYKKNDPGMYDRLKSNQDTAIKNAEKLLKQYNPPNPGKDNPSTKVHELVKELNRYIPDPG